MKNKKRKIRSEKGSITIFVIVTMLFIVIASLLLYSRVMNNKSTENRQVKQIESQYSVSNDQLAEAYNDVSSHVTVTFDANGGQVSTSPKRVKIGDSYGSLPTPTRDGYKFMGWNGKNLLNYDEVTDYANWDHNLVSNGDYPTNSGNPGFKLNVVEGKTYTISITTQGTDSNGVPPYFYLCKMKNNEGFLVSYLTTNRLVNQNFTFTVDDGEIYFLRIGGSSNDNHRFNTNISTLTSIQLEESSTVTPYEPYFVTSSTKVTQTKDHTLTAIWEEE